MKVKEHALVRSGDVLVHLGYRYLSNDVRQHIVHCTELPLQRHAARTGWWTEVDRQPTCLKCLVVEDDDDIMS